ncbi:hypothetical protein EJB05_16912, partial [Eragrostis curvula]
MEVEKQLGKGRRGQDFSGGSSSNAWSMMSMVVASEVRSTHSSVFSQKTMKSVFADFASRNDAGFSPQPFVVMSECGSGSGRKRACVAASNQAQLLRYMQIHFGHSMRDSTCYVPGGWRAAWSLKYRSIFRDVRKYSILQWPIKSGDVKMK